MAQQRGAAPPKTVNGAQETSFSVLFGVNLRERINVDVKAALAVRIDTRPPLCAVREGEAVHGGTACDGWDTGTLVQDFLDSGNAAPLDMSNCAAAGQLAPFPASNSLSRAAAAPASRDDAAAIRNPFEGARAEGDPSHHAAACRAPLPGYPGNVAGSFANPFSRPATQDPRAGDGLKARPPRSAELSPGSRCPSWTTHLPTSLGPPAAACVSLPGEGWDGTPAAACSTFKPPLSEREGSGAAVQGAPAGSTLSGPDQFFAMHDAAQAADDGATPPSIMPGKNMQHRITRHKS